MRAKLHVLDPLDVAAQVGDVVTFTVRAQCTSTTQREDTSHSSFQVLTMAQTPEPLKHSCEYSWCQTTSRHSDDGHSCEIGYVAASLSTSGTVDSSGASLPAVGVGVRFLRDEPGVYLHLTNADPDIDVDVDLRPDEAQRVIDKLTRAVELARQVNE